MSDDHPAPTEAEAPPEAQTKSFLNAYTVLAIVTVAVWVLAFIVPAGQYQRDANGSPISGSYQEILSTSGHATLAMPIMAPLADFAGVSRSLVITAWAAASGWMNLWVPTTAVVMGGLTLAKVGYDKCLKFIVPLLGILIVAVCLFLGGAALLGVG